LLCSFCNLGTRWGGWSTPCPNPLPPGKNLAHCIGVWVSSRAILDSAENLALRKLWTLNHVLALRKLWTLNHVLALRKLWTLNHVLALRKLWTLNHVHSCYTYYAILAHLLFMKEYVGCRLAAFGLEQG